MFVHSAKFTFVALLIGFAGMPLFCETPELAAKSLKITITVQDVQEQLRDQVEQTMEESSIMEEAWDHASAQQHASFENDMEFFTQSNPFEDTPDTDPARELILDELPVIHGSTKYVPSAHTQPQ